MTLSKFAAMVSNKVCFDKSTYTDSSQQGQSQSALSPHNYSHTPVYLCTLPQAIYGIEMLRVGDLVLFMVDY